MSRKFLINKATRRTGMTRKAKRAPLSRKDTEVIAANPCSSQFSSAGSSPGTSISHANVVDARVPTGRRRQIPPEDQLPDWHVGLPGAQSLASACRAVNVYLNLKGHNK